MRGNSVWDIRTVNGGKTGVFRSNKDPGKLRLGVRGKNTANRTVVKIPRKVSVGADLRGVLRAAQDDTTKELSEFP
jgi:hypothetical protein